MLRDYAMGEWGLTPTEYAQREKAKLREKIRKRIERERNELGRLVKAPEIAPERGPFETASGIKAYRHWVPNRTALGLPMTSKGEGMWVSLPFISMQHR